MTQQIDLLKYQEFVTAVTSNESKDFDAFINRMYELRETGVNIPLLMTSSMGMQSEVGEFGEILKKCLWQHKPLNVDNIHHMESELSDILWYWMNGCTALNINPYKVIEWNIQKLEARYPGGKFDAHYSENRQEGDI